MAADAKQNRAAPAASSADNIPSRGTSALAGIPAAATLYSYSVMCFLIFLNLFYPARRGPRRVRGQYRRGECPDAARHGRNGANDAIRFGESNIAAELLRRTSARA